MFHALWAVSRSGAAVSMFQSFLSRHTPRTIISYLGIRLKRLFQCFKVAMFDMFGLKKTK